MESIVLHQAQLRVHNVTVNWAKQRTAPNHRHECDAQYASFYNYWCPRSLEVEATFKPFDATVDVCVDIYPDLDDDAETKRPRPVSRRETFSMCRVKNDSLYFKTTIELPIGRGFIRVYLSGPKLVPILHADADIAATLKTTNLDWWIKNSVCGIRTEQRRKELLTESAE